MFQRTFISDEKLYKICEELGLNYDVLIRDKKAHRLYHIWIDLSTKSMIAYSKTADSDKIIYTDSFENLFRTIPRFETKLIEKQIPAVDLNMDAILEKIFQFGIDSLTKGERDFLDKASRSNF